MALRLGLLTLATAVLSLVAAILHRPSHRAGSGSPRLPSSDPLATLVDAITALRYP